MLPQICAALFEIRLRQRYRAAVNESNDSPLFDVRRAEMVRLLVNRSVARSTQVIEALSNVPRHVFLPPDAPDPYGDEPVLLKRDEDGSLISTASQPTMVALMLEALNVPIGARVLEVGTASGYNAALLAHLAGPTGHVTTVEIDRDLAAAARVALRRTGYENVDAVAGDGHEGWASRAPYDRIIVTAGARRVEPAWSAQLVDGGRLVVPITGSDRRGTCQWYEKVDGLLVLEGEMSCGFVPMRRPNTTEKT